MAQKVTSFVADLLARPGAFDEQPWLRIVLEAFLFSGMAIAIARAISGTDAAVVSIFLSAILLGDRFNAILEENRRDIYERQVNSWRANRLTAQRLFGVFLGISAAYVVAALVLGRQGTAITFRFMIEASHLQADTILTRRFGSFGSLVSHNALVMLTFCLLSFLVWGYGALLALCWNASLWSVALTLLIWRAADQASSAAFVGVASLAVLPHLLAESVAYLMAAMAAIFASKGIKKYQWRDPVLGSVLRAAATLAAAAVVMLVLAAALETVVAPALLERARALAS